MDSLQSLYNQLNQLETTKQTINNEIYQIKKQIKRLSPFSKAQKIALFKSLFIIRQDVYAKYWVSKDGMKKGYSPDTYTFKGNDYIPVNDNIIKKHLEGKIRIGSYAIVNQKMTKFLVIDLDKNSFIKDARAINDICKELNLYPLFEISKSGNGIHIWFFFETLVQASKVRKLGDLIITKAMDKSDGIDMGSYDRMFPNQDFVALDALGNLVALPLHYASRNENKTVFVDIETMQVFLNQWEQLRNIVKVSNYMLDSILKEYVGHNYYEQKSLMPWEIKKEKPILFPKQVNAVLYDALYIEKKNLSKQLIHKLGYFASFLNPEFYKLQNLRKSTFKTPRVITLFNMNEKYMIVPRGLTKQLKTYFLTNKSNLNIEDKRYFKNIDKFGFNLTLRDNQEKAFKNILKNDYSLLIAPPGFGKTAVACAIINKRKVNTLILIHKTTLLDQWFQRLCEYFNVDKKEIGQLGKSKKKITGNIDIAMLHSLRNRSNLIKEYTQIIIDEVHHIPAVSFEMPLKNFCGKYIVGLSATPKRQDGMHPIMYMQCGDIVYELKQQKKQTHTLKVIKTKFEALEDNFTLMLNEMVEDYDRNNLIINEIIKLNDKNILILSERVEHLNILYHLLEGKNIKTTLLHGGLKRKAQRLALEEAKDARIILSTSIFIGEGIDFPHLDTIVLTMPVSYDGRITQYLGRIGRRGQKCLAIDFVDEMTPMLRASFTKRLKAYKKNTYIIENKGLFC